MTLTKDSVKELLFNKYCKGKNVFPIILTVVFLPLAVYTCTYALVCLFIYLFTLNFFQVVAFLIMLLGYSVLLGVPAALGIVLLVINKGRKKRIDNEQFSLRIAECVSITKTGDNSYFIEFNNGQRCKTNFDIFSTTNIGDNFYLVYFEGVGKVVELYQASKYTVAEDLESFVVS